MKNRLLKLALVACLTLPASFLVGCGKDKDVSLVGINAYYAGAQITGSQNTLYIEYDQVEDFVENIDVKLRYSNNSMTDIDEKTGPKDGFVLTHNLPVEVTELHVGRTYDALITYANHSVNFSIFVDRISDQMFITNRLDKAYNGDTVDSPSVSKMNPNAATVEWFDSENNKLSGPPVNAGTYSVVVTTPNSETIKGASVRKNFVIAKATPIPTESIRIDGLTYDPTRKLADIEIEASNPEYYRWKNENIVPTCNKSAYKAVYNPDPNNYIDLDVEIGIFLEQAEYVVDIDTNLPNQYSDKVSKLADVELPHTHLVWDNLDADLVKGVNTFTATTLPTGTDFVNYKSTTKTFTFTYYEVLENLPTLNKKGFVYDGEEKSINIVDNYNAEYMQINNADTFTQTDKGEYNVSISTKADTYLVWNNNDNYVDAINIPWGIYEYDPYIDFELNADQDGYRVVGYSGDASKLVIPAVYNFKPVKSIAVEAFKNCITLEEIVLPDSVNFESVTKIKTIEQTRYSYEYYNTFEGCINLKSLTLSRLPSMFGLMFGEMDGEGVVEITQPVDYLNGMLTETIDTKFYIPSQLTTVKVLSGDLRSSAFENCTTITNLALEGVVSIGRKAFKNCTNLTEVAFGEGLTVIKSSAFENTNLTTIVLPVSLDEIYEEAFKGVNLTSVEFKDATWFVAQFKFDDGDYRWIYNSVDVSDIESNATQLTETYLEYRWSKTEDID